ncbi:MAG: HlyD family efflux transporter periplasmic adaptor subunit [Planctomycetales bacterium]
MTPEVDLRELAIDREPAAGSSMPNPWRLATRYAAPAALMLGFLSLAAWASWDAVFPPQPVTVVPVFSTNAEIRREGASLFKAAGWIEPRPTPTRVAALAQGVVEKLLVVEDQLVKAGEPIAELIKDDAKLVRDRASADLKLREAELQEAASRLKAAETRFNQPVHLDAEVGQAEASLAKVATQLKNLPFEVRRAEADQEAAEKEYQAKVAAKGVVAEVEIDVARSKLKAAEATVEELRDRDGSLQAEHAALARRRDALRTQRKLLADEIQAKEEAQAKLNAADARAESARVVVAEAELRLHRMTVRSPIDARVYQLIGHPGSRIGGGAGMARMTGHDGSTVVTLYRPEMLQVRVDVRFEDVPQISLNQPVRIENPAAPEPLTGKVLYISSAADIQKNTLQVKVAITNPPPVFKPETLVDVTFLAPMRTNQSPEISHELKLYVPRNLVRQENGESLVWLADQSEGVARKTRVEIGELGKGGLVEIKSGLTPSSRIISGGSDGLRDGDRIQVVGEDSSPGTNAGAEPEE